MNQRLKHINLKTWEVQALLASRKSMVRRVVKNVPNRGDLEPYKNPIGEWGFISPNSRVFRVNLPYHPGDILYVRETWKQAVCDPAGGGYGLTDLYLYKADEPIDTAGMDVEMKWHPSIHMPKEAARIFLRVTDVRVERLQDMSEGDVVAEGAELLVVCHQEHTIPTTYGEEQCWNYHPCKNCPVFKTVPEAFGERVWDTNLKPKDRAFYGWNANPWVWVIEFERVYREGVMV